MAEQDKQRKFLFTPAVSALAPTLTQPRPIDQIGISWTKPFLMSR